MPWLVTPRISAALISRPGSFAPTIASGAFMPTRTFVAPQTTCSGPPLPMLTSQSVSLSAFGCLATVRISPTTMPLKGGATALRDSTSRPDMVSRCASASVSSDGSTRARSQLSGISISELLEEAQVAVEEQAQVVDAVAEHRQALEAGAEREADVALGVEAEIADHRRMHLPRAGDFEPAPL